MQLASITHNERSGGIAQDSLCLIVQIALRDLHLPEPVVFLGNGLGGYVLVREGLRDRDGAENVAVFAQRFGDDVANKATAGDDGFECEFPRSCK